MTKGSQERYQAWSKSPELFEAITDLLADALFQDFQAHRSPTVHSPPGINRKPLLTPADNEH